MKRVLPIICIVSSIIGCAVPTKPNISAIYRVPALKAQLQPLPAKSQQLTQDPFPVEAQKLFQRLYTLAPALALEVGKLPEFQGKVGERQIRALTRFTELIANATTEEKANLAMLLKVGKPEIRRYCAPLQAIYWLLEEDKCLLRNPLQYSLRDILSYAWDFNEEYRWKDFQIVTDRLNSPVLLNYYEQWNLKYKSNVGATRFKSAYEVFRSKSGACTEYTIFTLYCLKKAGYKARGIRVKSPTRHPKGHAVCEYKDKDGKEYIMDNSCVSCGSGEGITEKEIYTKELPIISTDLFSIDGESII